MLDRKTKSRAEAKKRQFYKGTIQRKLIDKTKDCSVKSMDTTKTK